MKHVTIITGHYGTGKTNLAVNLALQEAQKGEKVTVLDIDLVNPYFRTADFQELFQKNDIRLVVPTYANTNLDTPVFNFDLGGLLSEDRKLIIDVGGDDAGAAVMGRFASQLMDYQDDMDMIYVINQCRALTTEPAEAVEVMHEIEFASRMKHTAVVNNTNLGKETTREIIQQSLSFAQKTAELAGVPLLYTTVPEYIALEGAAYLPIQIFVKPVWDI